MKQASSIVVNARFLTQPVTGVQQFARTLSRALVQLDKDIRFVAPPGVLDATLSKELHVEVVGKKSGVYWEQRVLPRYLKQQGYPLLLNLCNAAPMRYSNQVVTIHDLAFERYPESFSRPFRTWYALLLPKIARRARHVLTVSEFSKAELREVYGLHKADVSVVHNSLAGHLRTQGTPDPDAPNYLLAVGSLDPRKNLRSLVKAFTQLEAPDLQLWIAGGQSEHFAQQEDQQTAWQDERIRYLGYVPDEQLPGLYAGAQAFISPSLYEGFGLPMLEALHAGCPVIASDIPVYQELFAPYFIPIPPNDPEETARILEGFLAGKRSAPPIDPVFFERFAVDAAARKVLDILNRLR
ncbi:MAG: glycosyltransferase family 4 protein [Leptolyngbya sp. SIO3F4]|nr:glycosyltransferase family 4 protein [Leptolyngbya sp. SIO3F4]